MGCADAAEGADGGAEILVVARDEQPATPPAKASDGGTFVGREAVPAVDGEEPELGDVRRVERREDGVVAARGAVAGHDVVERGAAGVPERREMIAQQREAPDVPVVGGRRDGGLQQYACGSAHGDL